MARTREKFKGRTNSGFFFRAPIDVLDSERYISLSFKSRALLFDLGAQFRGHNNGDLAAPWSWMKLRGWRSKDTLQRALFELLATGMIELTRQGGLHCPNLYAVTWLGINDCGGKLDVRANPVPSGQWKLPLPDGIAPITGRPPRSPGHTAPTAGLGNPGVGPMTGVHCPDHCP